MQHDPESESLKDTRRRAAAGDPQAQYDLGIMFKAGDGAPRDSIEAYAWLTLAAFHQFPNAFDARRAIARTLESALILEGTRRAKRYLDGYARHPSTKQ